MPRDQPGGEKSTRQRGNGGVEQSNADVEIEIMTTRFSREITPIGLARHARRNANVRASRYIASNDLIDEEINAVRGNLFATLLVKAPADTGWLRSLLETDTIMINVKTGFELD